MIFFTHEVVKLRNEVAGLFLYNGAPSVAPAQSRGLPGEDSMSQQEAGVRKASVSRETLETQIAVELCLDGTGQCTLDTGLPFLEHMLDQIARHGQVDLDIKANGDLHIDAHHTVEDIGITLGQAFNKAIGDKKGIVRYGHAYVPLDEALSRVVIDCSGRPGLEFHVPFTRAKVGEFDVDLVVEFFQGFVNHADVTLHVDNLRGHNAHHQAETVFKAFGRALRMAVAPDAAMAGTSPSTKGVL
ncbi:MAG: Histidine biosynthesis bifunctional protein HisB [Halieaceae bacterium]|nr:MAG: Histidine biosynthesis bifunctional protein HisB [Halieaceae bacterium]